MDMSANVGIILYIFPLRKPSEMCRNTPYFGARKPMSERPPTIAIAALNASLFSRSFQIPLLGESFKIVQCFRVFIPMILNLIGQRLLHIGIERVAERFSASVQD